ncbi:mitochondrial small ribosomal subunit Rsm22-domain-containing protein [Dichotomocladium elegans]|nr:mitochondrial small ribosomal subunit Rsm22-domain-containing protein [Dichotomocladium elegans]
MPHLRNKFVQLARPVLTRRRWHSTEKAIFLDQKQLEALEHLESVPWSEVPTSSEPVVRRSAAAEYGRKRIGAVQLPKTLIQGAAEIIQGMCASAEINQGGPPKKKKEREEKSVASRSMLSLSLILASDKKLIRTDALRLYESLRSTSRIINADDEKPNSEPHTLTYGPRESVAYMAGLLPTAYAATANVLNELSQRISDFKPRTMMDFGTGPGTALWAAHEVYGEFEHCVGVDLSDDMLTIAEQLKASVAPRSSIEFKRYLSWKSEAQKPDLVVCAFTLGDISSAALQKSIVGQLWDMTGDTLVLIDRGTPIGFSNIARARQHILDTTKDMHVVAPCPHDKPCPLLFSPNAKPDKLWCHFSQRVQRPSFLMKTKHSKSNVEDAKYAYVVLRHGSRPAMKEQPDYASEAYTWPRLVQAPIKRHGHVVMDVCTKEGKFYRTCPINLQGKIPYRDARKVAWGDLFPHPPKNKATTRMSEGIVQGTS